MTEEELHEIIQEQNHISDLCGMVSYQHFLEYKENAIQGLMTFGDSFLEALGIALSEANDRNSVKIIRTWRNECSVHEMLWKMDAAKQLARNLELDIAKRTSDSIQL